MPLSVRSLAAMLLAAAGLAACARAQAPLSYETIATAPPDDPIEFVHVEREQGELRLGVYARRRQLVAWIADVGPSADPLLVLGDREWFFRSPDARWLGVRSFLPRAPAPGDPPDADLETALRLEKRPGPPAFPAVLGPRIPRISRDGSTLLLAPPRGEVQRTATIRILRRAGPGSEPFAELGTYTVEQPGSVRMSRAGDVIAQQDGGEIRLLDGSGVERARVPAGSGFELGPLGNVLAVRRGRQVLLRQLAAARPVPGTEQVVALADLALGVEVVGPFALARSRTELVLVRWPARVEVWRRTASAGTYTSADLHFFDGSTTRVVAGRLDISIPPHRGGGTVVWGRAQAYVDVLDSDGLPAFQSHAFATSRWTYEEPWVRLVDRGRRVLAHTGDLALLSEAMP